MNEDGVGKCDYWPDELNQCDTITEGEDYFCSSQCLQMFYQGLNYEH